MTRALTRSGALWAVVTATIIVAACGGDAGTAPTTTVESVAAAVTSTAVSTSASPTSTGAATTAPPPTTIAKASTLPTPTTGPIAGSDLTPLATIVGDPDVAGFVGPYSLADGTQFVLLSRSGQDVSSNGTVELATAGATGWRITQLLHAGIVAAPLAIGDVTGDGMPEFEVSMIGLTGGTSRAGLFLVDVAGPTLVEVPFDFDALTAANIDVATLIIDAVRPDHVDTTVTTCQPSCATDPGQAVSWTLDRSGVFVLRPDLASVPSGCTSNAFALDTGVATGSAACADGWAAGVVTGCSGECEGAEIFRLDGLHWTYIGYYYAVCSESLAAIGMPANAATQLAWMSCDTSQSQPTRPTSVLQLGDTGDAVIDLQRNLVWAGYPVSIDGVFGAGTEAAVRAFQADWGLEIDGQVGPATFAALEDAGVSGD